MTEAELCKKFHAWVHKLAGSFRRRYVSANYDDLVQAGFVGLLIGAKRWREDGGSSLFTYVTPWIKGSMREHLENSSGPVRVPRGKKSDPGRLPGLFIDGNGRFGRAVGEDMREREDDPDDQYTPRTLSGPAAQEDAFAEHEEAARVREAVEALPTRERELVTMVMVEGNTYEATGKRVGLSRERVRQIVKQANDVIRKRLESAA